MVSVFSRVAICIAAIAVLAVASACSARSSSDQENTPPSSTVATTEGARNAGDVVFLQGMIKHHQQGIDLSAMVPAHTSEVQLIALAQQIAAQQRTEIDGFRAQLLQWEEPLGVPPGQDIAGMVDRGTVDKLKTLHGSDFDRQWLEAMITYHRGAIAMAHDEIAHGESIDVVSIAKSVAASQQAELDQVNRMLAVTR